MMTIIIIISIIIIIFSIFSLIFAQLFIVLETSHFTTLVWSRGLLAPGLVHSQDLEVQESLAKWWLLKEELPQRLVHVLPLSSLSKGKSKSLQNCFSPSLFLSLWVPEDIFFLSILTVRGEEASTRSEVPRRKSFQYQPVSFILGILRTDPELWSQGAKCVVCTKKKNSNVVSTKAKEISGFNIPRATIK